MMTVCVYINGRKIAEAAAQNRSNLAATSDYDCQLTEEPGPFGPGKNLLFRIKGHNREQTCWALVERLASAALSSTEQQP